MEETQFKAIRDFFEETLVFDESDKKLTSLTRSLPGIYQKAIKIYTDQYQTCNNLKTVKEELYGKLYMQHKKNNDRSFSKPEIDIIIQSESKYRDIKIEYNTQEMYLKYLDFTIDNIKKISFQVKNYIEIKKFFQGDSY
jgi:hypothetical protein